MKSKDTAIKEVKGYSSAYPYICNLKLLPNIDGTWITIQDDVGTSMTIKLSDLSDYMGCENSNTMIKEESEELGMTNERASEILDDYDVNFHGHTAEEVAQAFDCAFKALKQEPCDDAISRQAVNILVDELARAISDELCCMPRGKIIGAIMQDIRDLPPVTPQPKYEDIAKAFQLGLAFGFGEKHDEMNKIMEEIKKVIEPEPKTGRWIDENKDKPEAKYGRHLYICQKCNKSADYFVGGTEDWWDIEKPNFCPNCGAKMEGAKE